MITSYLWDWHSRNYPKTLAILLSFRNGVMALMWPNNLEKTIYGFLSPFQEKEKNDWSTVGKHEKAVMAATEFLSSFQANISWDFCLHVWSWFIDFMKAKYHPSCIGLVATVLLLVWYSLGMLRYDWLKMFAKWTKKAWLISTMPAWLPKEYSKGKLSRYYPRPTGLNICW